MTASCYFHLCFSELTAQHLVVKYVHYVQICTSWFTSSGNTAPMWCSEVESKGVQAQSVTLMQEAHQNKLYAQFRDLCIPQCLNKRVSGWCAHLVWVYMYTNPTWAFCLYFSVTDLYVLNVLPALWAAFVFENLTSPHLTVRIITLLMHSICLHTKRSGSRNQPIGNFSN